MKKKKKKKRNQQDLQLCSTQCNWRFLFLFKNHFHCGIKVAIIMGKIDSIVPTFQAELIEQVLAFLFEPFADDCVCPF